MKPRGFEVEHIELAPLPVRLGTGMGAFLETFCENFFRPLASEDREKAKAEMIELIRPALCDREGNWTMDFVRLRFSTAADRVGVGVCGGSDSDPVSQ